MTEGETTPKKRGMWGWFSGRGAEEAPEAEPAEADQPASAEPEPEPEPDPPPSVAESPPPEDLAEPVEDGADDRPAQPKRGLWGWFSGRGAEEAPEAEPAEADQPASAEPEPEPEPDPPPPVAESLPPEDLAEPVEGGADDQPAQPKRGLWGWFSGRGAETPEEGQEPPAPEPLPAPEPDIPPPEPEQVPPPSEPPGRPPPSPGPDIPPPAVEPPGPDVTPPELPPPSPPEWPFGGERSADVALVAAPVERPLDEPGAVAEAPEAEAPEAKGWLARLKDGLGRSSSRLTQGIADLFTKRRLDAQALEDLEELLIAADLGVAAAARMTALLADSRFNHEVSPEEIRTALAEEVARVLEPVARPLALDATARPHVVLVVGVNGSGKTTTIGKLARQYRDQGLAVSIAAGDTFRAAAVAQLKVWGERAGCPVTARADGADAAGLAFDALTEAKARGDEVLLIDTAGRLQNKTHLMAELQKIVRVLKKMDPAAPHSCLLVLDATVGQNAHSQVEVFRQMTDVTGLVVTKLDGTARGGVLVALAERFGLPVHWVGVGEGVADLRPFSARDFARGLMGLN